MASPSLRGRGLKLTADILLSQIPLSPSLRGRGLKYWFSFYTLILCRSPSLRGRGLKSPAVVFWEVTSRSPSLRGRGLKSEDYTMNQLVSAVALFTRAWIEMVGITKCWQVSQGRPLYEGVDWNKRHWAWGRIKKGRPLYEGVDWNNIA